MGFIMDGLDAEEYDRQYNDRDLVKRILGYFRPEAPRMLIVSIAIFLTSIVNTALPIFISDSIDRIAANPSGRALALVLLGVIVISTLGWLFNAVRQWQSAAAVGNVTLKSADGEVQMIPGEWQEFHRIDLSELQVKGAAGDIVTVIGGTW